MDEITIRVPDDFHVHLRDGEMVARVLTATCSQFGRALAMPNTIPPICTAEDALTYHATVRGALPQDCLEFELLLSIKLTTSTTKAVVQEARERVGVIAGKLYPEGVTTNSADGVRDVRDLFPVFEEMERVGMVLCLHGEVPGVFCLEREASFLTVLDSIAETFPQLRIVLEHVSSRVAVEHVQQSREGVVASVTPQHLLLTLDDVVGDLLSPHNFCKPVPKSPEDRDALVDAATSGDRRFFLGTDSAPHPVNKKEGAAGAAGVFSAPVALPVIAEIFDKRGKLESFEAFCSENGRRFYGLSPNEGTITLRREVWRVPELYAGVRPLCAGRELTWRVVGRSPCFDDAWG